MMASTNLAHWKERLAKRIRTVAHGETRLHSFVAVKAARLVIQDRGGDVTFVTGGHAISFRTWRAA